MENFKRIVYVTYLILFIKKFLGSHLKIVFGGLFFIIYSELSIGYVIGYAIGYAMG